MKDIASGNPQLVGRCYGLISYSVCPRDRILLDIYLAVCCRIVKSNEFKLSYSELSENCTIAELTNNLEPIVYKYNTCVCSSHYLALPYGCSFHSVHEDTNAKGVSQLTLAYTK